MSAIVVFIMPQLFSQCSRILSRGFSLSSCFFLPFVDYTQNHKNSELRTHMLLYVSWTSQNILDVLDTDLGL
jgi:hypothetical protein